jgi:hypothetical protein
MGIHDQIFKELASGFAADFLTLTLPDVAAAIDLGAFVLRTGGDHFLDSPLGRRRTPDLTGHLRGLGEPPEEAMVHIEVEARFRSACVPRLADYNRLLTLRYGVGVHTVVIYVRGGPPGLREQEHSVKSFGRQPWTFRYTSLGLSGASGREYLERPEPLAWGLAALMRPEGFRSRARLGVDCLTRILADPDLDEARCHRLVNCVETYVESDEETAPEFERLLRRGENQEVQMKRMTKFDRLREEGKQEGWQEGKREGKQEGMQELVLRLLTTRFGQVSKRIRDRVRATTSTEDLTKLAERAVQAGSLRELGLA